MSPSLAIYTRRRATSLKISVPLNAPDFPASTSSDGCAPRLAAIANLHSVSISQRNPPLRNGSHHAPVTLDRKVVLKDASWTCGRLTKLRSSMPRGRVYRGHVRCDGETPITQSKLLIGLPQIRVTIILLSDSSGSQPSRAARKLG
jgi:hypothetical protein